MKTAILILCFTLVAFASVTNAQKIITVTDSSGLNTRVFDNLDSAVAKSTHGDFIYLPGGSFNVSNFTIDKRLNIIGAGHRVDSAAATGISILNGTLTIVIGGDRGSVSGVYITADIKFGTNSADEGVNGYTISRCNISQFQLSYLSSGTNTNIKNINILESVFRGNWNYGGYAKNVRIEKCIFNGRLFYFNSSVDMSNNIFLFRSSSWPLFNDIKNASIYNNIILQDANVSYSSNVNDFHNNIFANGTGPGQLPGQILSNNAYNIHGDSIFIGANYSNLNYSESQNYHLLPLAIAAIKGTDGTQVGLYGTAYPYKDGAVPMNPHISFKSIAPSTNSAGKINVNIKVRAQDY